MVVVGRESKSKKKAKKERGVFHKGDLLDGENFCNCKTWLGGREEYSGTLLPRLLLKKKSLSLRISFFLCLFPPPLPKDQVSYSHLHTYCKRRISHLLNG